MIPQRWLVLSVRSSDDLANDILPSALVALGGRAVVEDADGWFTTHLIPQAEGSASGAPGDEGGGDQEAELGSPRWDSRLREEVQREWGLHDVELRHSWQEHGDWAELWKQGWEARHVSPRLMVVPTWIELPPLPDVSVRSLRVDPGMAFGTAEHATTRGCLRLLDGVIRGGETVLDVGAGSAILSVAAVLLGAKGAVAVEGDPLACPAARENVELNEVAHAVEVVESWVSPEDLQMWSGRDVVLANIETGVLLPLMDGLAGALHPGGALILSGILLEEVQTVKDAASAAGLRWEAEDQEGAWWSGLFRRDMRSSSQPSPFPSNA
ncbi:MAG: 50S ribosomal protein L11 methyltransferase [Gemmatimonadota bacterium]